jgi:pimeloyl-ACP methyl ester carboxylesterase
MTTHPIGDVELHVQERGSGDPVLLLHSSGMNGEQWRRTAEKLAERGFRAVIPDLLGSGRSPAWPDKVPFGFRDDVAVIRHLLVQLKTPVHLVGHSYGGMVALSTALLESAAVRSLALYDPVALGVLDAELDADAFADVTRVTFHFGDTSEQNEAWLRQFVDYWSGDGAWNRLRDDSRAEFVRTAWVTYAGARSLVDDRTPADAYRPLVMPTLLLTGEVSPLAERRVVARLGGVIPRARSESIPGAGHMGPLTHPRAFHDLLMKHLSGPIT